MYGKINFGNEEVELKATAATAPLFRRIFSFDLLKTLNKMRDLDEKEGDEQIDEAFDAYELISKIGFIMAKQAEGADFGKMRIDDYYLWLDKYEPNSIPVGEILQIYNGNEVTVVDSKKEDAVQNES